MRSVRRVGLGLALAAFVAAFASEPVLANGVGDLYVASPAGILEIHVATSRVVNTVQVTQQARSLAFAPDGRTLFVAGGDSYVTPIDIESLEVGDPIALPAATSVVAFPNGDVLVGALPAHKTLALIRPSSGQVSETAVLPGQGDLLAADRHDARVAVAETGKSWLAVVDTANPTVRKTTLTGSILALAVERDRGGVLVATTSPSAVLRIDMATLAVSWSAPLNAAPTAVAALADGAIVATGTDLWKVGKAGATAWAHARASVRALAPSDEGKALHAMEAAAIEVFDAAGAQKRTVSLAGDQAPLTLAAVPAGSSLFTGTTSNPSASPDRNGSSGGSGTGSPPVTSTIVAEAQRLANQPPVQGALAVAIVILGACWWIVRWSDRRGVRL